MSKNETIDISLDIDNVYSGRSVKTHVEATVAAPPPLSRGDDDLLRAWAFDVLFPLTGTGDTSSPSGYIVTVVGCSDTALLGKKFEFF